MKYNLSYRKKLDKKLSLRNTPKIKIQKCKICNEEVCNDCK